MKEKTVISSVSGNTKSNTKWEIQFTIKDYPEKGKNYHFIVYTIDDGTQFGADVSLKPEEVETWIEDHDPMVIGRKYWAF